MNITEILLLTCISLIALKMIFNDGMKLPFKRETRKPIDFSDMPGVINENKK